MAQGLRAPIAFAEDPGSTPVLPIMPVPGYLILSSRLLGHMMYIHECRHNIHTYKIKIKYL